MSHCSHGKFCINECDICSPPHTPTPWRIDLEKENRIENSEGYTVTWVSGAEASVNFANTEFIVRACNNFEELLGTLKAMVKEIETAESMDCFITYEEAQKAIAKAEAKS